jgi:hypothetical protein
MSGRINVLKALDEHLVADLDVAREEAASALERYVAAHMRISELEAALGLRRAMGASLAGEIRIEPLRESA